MSILHSELLSATNHLSILFVEDYQPFVDEMEEILLELFCDVVISKDGEEALNEYINYNKKNDKNFDIVLTDIRLPKFNGIELSKAIYTMHSTQNIIVLSSYTDTEDLLELLNMGIKRFIKKPVNYDELCDTLYHVCEMFSNNKEKLIQEHHMISIGANYIWDSKKNILLLNNKEVHCTLYELVLLQFLTKHKNMVCTVEMITEFYNYHNMTITAKSIRNLVLKIRQKTYKECIQNIYGLGYCLHRA